MSDRSEELAQRFEERLAQVVAYTDGLSDQELLGVVADDGRQLNVILYHVAVAFSFHRRFFRALLAGEWQPFTEEWVDTVNAQGDAGHTGAQKPEILDQLSGRGAALAQSIRDLGDADLDREVEFRAATPKRTLAQTIDEEVLGHLEEHTGALAPA
jgi:hypothetical protein